MVISVALYPQIVGINVMLREIDIQPANHVAFIHIPKTAGTTFNNLIHPYLTQLPWCPLVMFEQLTQRPYDEILQYHLFMGHFHYKILEKILPPGFISLTFLREPVSRTISHYRYLMRVETLEGPAWKDDELNLAKKMTFEEFINNEQLHLALDIINLQTNMLGGFEPLPEFTHNAQGNNTLSTADQLADISVKINSAPNTRDHLDETHLDIAKKTLAQIDFLGITERFQDSLFLLSFIFGWPPLVDSLHLNQRPNSEQETLDKDLLECIQNKVSLDLELYQFAQERFEQQFHQMTRLLWERYGSGAAPEGNQPLPRELIFDLLQKHYETRRNTRNQTLLKNIGRIYFYRPSTYAEGNFGWHSVEILPEDGAVAWSSRTDAGFDLPCPRGENLQISFRIVMVLAPDSIEKLSLTVNHTPITLQRKTDPKGAFIMSGNIPSQIISGPFLHLVFSVPRTLAPCDVIPDNKDARQLGILLNWVKLESLLDGKK
jgi:hypothetical protein